MAVSLFASILVVSASIHAAPSKGSFAAVDDATVRQGVTASSKNFGRDATLEVQNNRSGVSEAYIKFDLAGADAGLSEARLRLYISSDIDEATAMLVGSASDSNWLETVLTWKDKPTYVNTIGTLAITGGAAGWRELDLTSYIKALLTSGVDTMTLILTLPEGSNNKLTIQSREAASNQPEMIIARKVFKTRIVFQPKEKALPPTYVADNGLPYGTRPNGMTYGWSSDVSTYVRDREDPKHQEGKPVKAPDTRYNGVAFMDHANMSKPAFWEIALPNGKYRVHLVAGDPCAFDSIFGITVEDVLLVDGVPDEKRRWVENSRPIDVKDGRLTVNNHTKGINNKLCFIEIVETNEP